MSHNNNIIINAEKGLELAHEARDKIAEAIAMLGHMEALNLHHTPTQETHSTFISHR